MTPAEILPVAILSLMAIASALSFGLLAFDKRRARRGGRRVPERTLHLLELLGGWPGSLVARRTFRHKTVKGRYRLLFAACAVAHIAVATTLLILFSRH